MRNTLARYTMVALLIATACIASAGDEVDLLGLSAGERVERRDEPYLAMEFVPGTDMYHLVERHDETGLVVRGEAEGVVPLPLVLLAVGLTLILGLWFRHIRLITEVGGDTITLREGIHKLVRDNLESLAGHQVPGWLSFDPSTLTARIDQLKTTFGLPDVNDWRNDRWQAPGEGARTGLWRTQLSILALPSIWVLGLASATNYVVRYAINSWGILYLQEAKGYSTLEAGALLALNPLAGVAGCVAYGFMSDKLFGARRPPVNLLCGLMEIGAGTSEIRRMLIGRELMARE